MVKRFNHINQKIMLLSCVFLWENAQTVWGSGIKPPIQCQGKKQISIPLLIMIRFYVKMDFNNCDNTVTIYDNIIS